jgi:hypothetical protein
MGKYAPIRKFLESRHAATVPMTFAEIEKVLGFKLPNSQNYPAWWSNNPTNNVMTSEWLAAGYKTEQVDIEGRKLVFRRDDPTRAAALREGFGEGQQSSVAKQPRRHPLFGWMKGTFTIVPGTDLTAPADPDWAGVAEGKRLDDGSDDETRV